MITQVSMNGGKTCNLGEKISRANFTIVTMEQNLLSKSSHRTSHLRSVKRTSQAPSNTPWCKKRWKIYTTWHTKSTRTVTTKIAQNWFTLWHKRRTSSGLSKRRHILENLMKDWTMLLEKTILGQFLDLNYMIAKMGWIWDSDIA